MTHVSRQIRVTGVLCALLLTRAAAARAQTAGQARDPRPSFAVSSGTIATSREKPAIYLTFRRLDHLDFRVYRVKDPVAFLSGLKDPHQLGSEEPLVAQTPTLLERIADWKGEWRGRVRRSWRGARQSA